jgi:eukaryotic-like serine/threonine-protein kinase
MSCLSDAMLLGFVEQRLEPEQKHQVEAHVDVCPACRRLLAMLVPREPSLLGGHYELGRLIGRGSMGRVFEARDVRTDERVAIKRVQHANPEAVARFRREARLLEMFRHPGVVAIREVIDEPSGFAIVMERLEGVTLEQRLGSSSLTSANAQPILAKLFHIVAEAHDRGIVHRDLKPSNVYFDGERLLLLDFGLGTLSHTDSIAPTLTRLTRTGAVLGTFAYMSPERMEGRDSGPAGDVWSAGAIGWRMLVGASPHESEPPLPSVATRVGGVSADFAHCIDACLAANPSQRPSAREVADALCPRL